MKTVKSYLSQYIKKDIKIGLGISGGPDSMALLSIVTEFFIENNYPLEHMYAINCDHNLRRETKKEINIIKNYINPDIQFSSTKINQEKSKNEHTLRSQRYNVFDTAIKDNSLDYFLLGHNLTDRIESTYMNMLRGCSLSGFIAMQKISDHHLLGAPVLRPLLDFTKKEIQQYCDTKNIPYALDKSNDDSSYSMRNKLRNEVLPHITELSHKKTQENNTFFESYKQIYNQLEQVNRHRIHLKKIYAPDQWNAKFAYKIVLDPQQITIGEYGKLLTQLHIKTNITKTTLEEFVEFFNRGDNGHKYINNTYFFVINKELFAIQAEKDFWKKNIDNRQLIDRMGQYIINGIKVNITDPKYINCVLGTYKKGMRFKGKTRNKYCINNKIPVIYRKSIPLIYKEKEIKNYIYPLISKDGKN